jgi:Ni,Fe-hydrogenase I cytochrome b subunit
MIWNFILGVALVILAICGFMFVNPHIPDYVLSDNTGPVAVSVIRFFPIMFEIGILAVGLVMIYVACKPVVM